MKEWILSVVGVIALGVLVDIILPNGKIAKYVKGAFSLVVVLVISSIVPLIADIDFQIDADIGKYFSSESASTSQSFSFAKEKIEKELSEHDCICSVQIEWDNTLVKDVTVYVEKSNISGERIVEIIAECLSVNKNSIKVVYIN